MDALIVLLVIGGLIVSLVKKAGAKRKKSDSAQTPEPKAESGERIPYTKEEWAKYLASQGIARGKANPAAQTAKPAAQTAPRVPKAPVAAASAVGVQIEGESEAEHGEHIRRILAGEAEARQRCETARELRRVNRERLRSAIVLREILDPPISMRDE